MLTSCTEKTILPPQLPKTVEAPAHCRSPGVALTWPHVGTAASAGLTLKGRKTGGQPATGTIGQMLPFPRWVTYVTGGRDTGWPGPVEAVQGQKPLGV